jgi:hypothetical protein
MVVVEGGHSMLNFRNSSTGRGRTPAGPFRRLLGTVSLAGALAASGLAGAHVALAATIVVDCAAGADLQAAIAGAGAGDVLVISGTCVGNFTVDSDLRLRGVTGATLRGDGGTTLQVTRGSTVRVVGLLLTGGSSSGVVNQGILTISGSTVSGNSAPGSGCTTRQRRRWDGHAAMPAGGPGDGSFQYQGDYGGGGILNLGTLTLSDSTVSRNTSYSGGGIFNDGTASVIRSTIDENSTDGGGGAGGICNEGAGSLTVTDSAVTRNRDPDYWDPSVGVSGGILNHGQATVANSTMSGNFGSGLTNSSVMIVASSTVSGNSVDPAGHGGGISACGGGCQTLVGSSIVALNSPDDCGYGPVSSNGYNVAGGICELHGPGDQVPRTATVGLGPLGDNGGPTETRALSSSSPAVDAVPVGATGAIDGSPLCPGSGWADQRGVLRPQGSSCDAGSFELEHPRPPDIHVRSAVVISPSTAPRSSTALL